MSKGFKFLVVALIGAALTACSTLPGISSSEIDTVNKQIVVLDAEIRSVAILTQELYETGVITRSQARTVATALGEANKALFAAARAVESNGDPTQANNILEVVRRTILVAQNLLERYAPGRQASLYDGGSYATV